MDDMADMLIEDFKKFKDTEEERKKDKEKQKKKREDQLAMTTNFPQWFIGPGAHLTIESYAKYNEYPSGKKGVGAPVLVDQRFREILQIDVLQDPTWIAESNLLEIESLIQKARQTIVETTPGFKGHPWQLKPIDLDGLELKNNYSV
jgi:hypothetical protein